MHKSNFSTLIEEINTQIIERNEERNISKSLANFNEHQKDRKALYKRFTKASHKLQRELTPSKAELKKANQEKMGQFRQSLKDAIMSKAITGLEAIKLENIANRTSAKLAQRGLI